jgi:hypothetical protein
VGLERGTLSLVRINEEFVYAPRYVRNGSESLGLKELEDFVVGV